MSNIFGSISAVSEKQWPLRPETKLLVRLYLPVRQAIWSYYHEACATAGLRTHGYARVGALRLAPKSLAGDDGEGYNQLDFDDGDKLDAAILREMMTMALNRVKPGLAGPTPEAIEEMRRLIPQLDDFLGTPIVERMGTLGALD